MKADRKGQAQNPGETLPEGEITSQLGFDLSLAFMKFLMRTLCGG